MRRPTEGFTLIEMVIVVLIIGVLASIAIPNYRKVQLHAAAASVNMEIHDLEDELIQGLTLNFDRVLAASSSANAGELEAALGVTLPQPHDEVRFRLSRTADDLQILVFGTGPYGRKIVQEIGTMRPMVADVRGNGTFMVERIDFSTIAVREVAPPPTP